MPDNRPQALALQIASIPTVLIARPQWVTWRYERRHGKWTKIPIKANTGAHARSDDPSTWGTFDAALTAYRTRALDGVGFVFSGDDPYAGIDLDMCHDPRSRSLEPWALAIIEQLDSYTELSPSGTGVKIFVRGNIPPGGNRKGQIELYDHGRYFTVTGHRLPTLPDTLEPRQAALAALHARVFQHPAPHTPRPTSQPSSSQWHQGFLNDDELLTRALGARNGSRFASLWAGGVDAYASHSEADLALCGMLAFWCGPDAERIDRLFRRSGLYRPKWDAPHFANGQTYGAVTVERVLKRLHTCYQETFSDTSGGRPSRLIVEVA